MRPTVGRIVHYTPVTDREDDVDPPCAAIISDVHDSAGRIRVGIHVFQPGRRKPVWYREVPFSEEYRPGHWSWPPRS